MGPPSCLAARVSSAMDISLQLVTLSWRAQNSKASRALQGPQDVADSAELDTPAAVKSDTHDTEEWELSIIADEWKPAPLFKVLQDLVQYHCSVAKLC